LGLGMERAVARVVDPGALRLQLVQHPAVQLDQIVFGEHAARDAGLVGDDENEVPRVVEPSDRRSRARYPTEALDRADIAVVVVDDAVAIEERGWSARGRGGHGALSSEAPRGRVRAARRAAPGRRGCRS